MHGRRSTTSVVATLEYGRFWKNLVEFHVRRYGGPVSATSARGVALRSSLAALTKPSPFREFSEAGISEAE